MWVAKQNKLLVTHKCASSAIKNKGTIVHVSIVSNVTCFCLAYTRQRRRQRKMREGGGGADMTETSTACELITMTLHLLDRCYNQVYTTKELALSSMSVCTGFFGSCFGTRPPLWRIELLHNSCASSHMCRRKPLHLFTWALATYTGKNPDAQRGKGGESRDGQGADRGRRRQRSQRCVWINAVIVLISKSEKPGHSTLSYCEILSVFCAITDSIWAGLIAIDYCRHLHCSRYVKLDGCTHIQRLNYIPVAEMLYIPIARKFIPVMPHGSVGSNRRLNA